MPTPPNTSSRVRIKLDPGDRVPYSGKPVGIFSCRDNPHTWYWDQILHGETGLRVTFDKRVTFINGRYFSTNTQKIELAGNGTAVLHHRWCSAYTRPNYVQVRFTGTVENGEQIDLSGPYVQLLTPP